MPNLFLSYSRSDYASAEILAKALSERGHRVWWDNTILPGEPFRARIARELAAADCVLVLWTQSAIQSNWVVDEADEAGRRGVLIPILLEEIQQPHGFRQLQTASLIGWLGDQSDQRFLTLLAAIENLLSRTTIAASRTSPSLTASSDPWRSPPGWKLWRKGEVIPVSFIGGTKRTRRRAREWAAEWTRYANISFHFAARNGVIRVAFEPGNGSWSFIGTDALSLPSGEPTMNLGYLDAAPDREAKFFVLHEFGHALGLVHEYASPNAKIDWNKPALYADLGGPPNNWTPKQVDAGILRKYTEEELPGYREFDSASVMMYELPARWTYSRMRLGGNYELSESDKQFVARLYPGRT